MAEQIARNLRRFREILGWTQEHLAEATGLSVRTIQRAEKDGELGAETLLALAAVFDISVADIQRSWPTDEEIREATEEAAKKYKMIPLIRIERASDLRTFMGVHAWQVDHIDGLSEAQEDEVAVLAELLRDYGDLWSEIGPTDQREALKTIYDSIERLHASGLFVGMGVDAMRLVSHASPEPWTMDVLRVLVSYAAEPKIAVLRERNCQVRFA